MSEQKNLYKQYVEKMESIKDPYFKNVNKDLFNGQNSYLRMRMKGSSSFNDEWIDKIEDCIYELGQIINNPLEVTKTEGELTPVELAKKINYESIQHLASHSQYIKDIDENGNVIPAKILSQFHKEELHTYENRFIATFIRRLVLFVEKRYEFIKTTVNFDTKDVLYVKNRSVVDGQEVTIETKVTLKKANEDTNSKIGREFVRRVENMRRYVTYFYNSPFMKELKTEKNVRKPILQTNIIRKNPYYRKCYETFLFIEKFSSLGIEYALDEKYQDFNEKERKALNYILTSNLLSLEATEESKTYKKAQKTYKPRLLSSCDDEIFTYGDLVKGPIEFVRVDEKYTEWLNAQLSTKIPPKPNKVEKEYFKDEIDLKKNTKKHISEVDALLKRVRREIAKWEKQVLKLIEQRNIQEAKEAEQQLANLRKEEHSILEKKRKEIMAAAQDEKSELKARRAEEIAREQEEIKLREEEIRRQIEEAAQKAVEEVHQAEETEAQEEAKAEETQSVEEISIESPAEEETAPVVEEQPAVEEPAPVEEIKEEPVPEISEEQPANEEHGAEETMVVEEAPKEEPVQEEPAVEEPAQVEEPAPIEEAQSEPQPEPEPAPIEEPKVEEPVTEQPKEEKAPKKSTQKKKSAGKTGDNNKPKAKKPAKKPSEKPAKKVEEPKVEEEPVKKVSESVQKIPGRFIVKSNKGYVISKTEFTDVKSRARVFDDFNDARRYKTMFGGKVIKL